MDLDIFYKNIYNSFFTIFAIFQRKVIYKILDLQELIDSSSLRACYVFIHCKLVDVPIKCIICKAPYLIQSRNSNKLQIKNINLLYYIIKNKIG